MGELAEALRDLEEERVYALVEEGLSRGVSPLDILDECNAGMVGVGELFSSNEYFLSQLIYSAEIFKGVMSRIGPLLQDAGTTVQKAGTVVIGTVQGDIHDIGKNIAASLLRGHGFEVIDLGVDVPPARFVETVQESGARVVGLSALLNFTFPTMKGIVDALKAAGLREKVTVIIGGAQCNEQVRAFTGADHFVVDAVAGVNICKRVYA